MAKFFATREFVGSLVLLTLALVPVFSLTVGDQYYLVIATRIMVMGLAALGLNLVLGYGGLVSLGHALYLGLGAYAVGILSESGIHSGTAHLMTALTLGCVVSLIVGLVCLRASGMAFIMITLAFAQMAYFVVVGLKAYGGEDGLSIPMRSTLGQFSLDDPSVLYYVVYVCLLATLAWMSRAINSRFGMVLRGSKTNEQRMAALGFPTFRYRLFAYVISAQICVLAGMLLANLTRFASPSYMAWTLSGELIMMVVLGGMGTLVGPIVGAALLLVLEEVLTSMPIALPWDLDTQIKDHWLAVMGLFIVVATLAVRRGLYGSLRSVHEQVSGRGDLRNPIRATGTNEDAS